MAKRKTKIAAEITVSEAFQLEDRLKAGTANENLLGVIMPNGEQLRDCAFDYVAQIEIEVRTIGSFLDQMGVFGTKNFASTAKFLGAIIDAGTDS